MSDRELRRRAVSLSWARKKSGGGGGEDGLPLFWVPFSRKSLAHAEVTKCRNATSKLGTTIRREKVRETAASFYFIK